jgi:UDP-glucose 4-epimerase
MQRSLQHLLMVCNAVAGVFSKQRQKMFVVAFGGTGFIGTHVVGKLLAAGHRVRVISRRPVQSEMPASNVAFIRHDLASSEDRLELPRLLDGADVVVHLASSTTPTSAERDVLADVNVNLVPLVALLTAMARSGVKRLVYASSGGTVYGVPKVIPVPEDHVLNPIGSYGIGKMAAEAYIRHFCRNERLSACILRPSNPYGERQGKAGEQGLVGTLLRCASTNQAIEIWGDGTAIRDYLHVDDLARLFVRSIEADIEGTFNAGSGIGTSVREMIELVSKVTGCRLRLNYGPDRPVDVPVSILDTALASERFGWRPEITLEAGLARTWEWIQSESRSA